MSTDCTDSPSSSAPVSSSGGLESLDQQKAMSKFQQQINGQWNQHVLEKEQKGETYGESSTLTVNSGKDDEEGYFPEDPSPGMGSMAGRGDGGEDVLERGVMGQIITKGENVEELEAGPGAAVGIFPVSNKGASSSDHVNSNSSYVSVELIREFDRDYMKLRERLVR